MLDPASGRDEIADLAILDGRIAAPEEADRQGATALDARGLVVTPGLIDLHVHLREPGLEEAETVDSGLRAAARGGFVAVVAMPNTTPPIDTPEAMQRLLERARSAGHARVWPAASLTAGRAGQTLANLEALAAAGAVAFTDDGATVANDRLMEEAMRRATALGRPILDHALDPQRAGRGVMREGARARAFGWPGIPAEAESVIVERDIRLAQRTGCAVHIQHVSTAAALRLIRAAKAKGLPVSAEATPHHLALTEAVVLPDRPETKMNPPLGTEEDRLALLEAVADGTVQVLATDHAPHTTAAKQVGFLRAPFGVVGLETAVGVTFTLLVRSGRMSLMEWLRRWTLGPSRVLGLPAPTLAAGAPASLTLLDLETEWTVRAADFVSRSRNTPFEKWTLRGRAVHTWLDGRRSWSADSEIAEKSNLY